MRTLLLLWIALTFTASARAQLPSLTDQPYQLMVCLQFSDNQAFTDFFQESVRRQVRDQLTNYFGPLADVIVLTEYPALSDPDATALSDLTAPELSPADNPVTRKLFLMAIEFEDGLYHMKWRQFDGDVQQLGPLYERSTPDRQWLAKAICLAVKKDFAPVASVEPGPDGSEVRLDFRGVGRLTPEFRRRFPEAMEEGCVLQPFWVVQYQNGGLGYMPIPNTVLRINPDARGTSAAVITSLKNPWQRTARVIGFRAVKLTTCKGRFRLRLINSTDGTPVRDCIVYARSTGFDDPDKRVEAVPMTPDREGYVVPDEDEVFDQVAYITVKQATTIKVPVPITQSWCELEWEIVVDEAEGKKREWARQVRYCNQDIRVLNMIFNDVMAAVDELNDQKRYEEALKKITSAMESVRIPIKALEETVAELEAQAVELDISNDQLFVWVQRNALEIYSRPTRLQELAIDLEKTIEAVDAQGRAGVLLKLAAEAEQAGDIDDAITKYELALQEWTDQPETKAHLDELKRVWEIKGPEHQEARDFVCDTYANADVDKLDELLADARLAFQTLIGLDDHLTVAKLANVNGAHLAGLTDILNALADRGEAGREENAHYETLVQDVLEFQEEILQYGSSR